MSSKCVLCDAIIHSQDVKGEICTKCMITNQEKDDYNQLLKSLSSTTPNADIQKHTYRILSYQECERRHKHIQDAKGVTKCRCDLYAKTMQISPTYHTQQKVYRWIVNELQRAAKWMQSQKPPVEIGYIDLQILSSLSTCPPFVMTNSQIAHMYNYITEQLLPFRIETEPTDKGTEWTLYAHHCYGPNVQDIQTICDLSS